jgi:hypothetical protein
MKDRTTVQTSMLGIANKAQSDQKILESHGNTPEDCLRWFDVDPQHATGHIVEQNPLIRPIQIVDRTLTASVPKHGAANIVVALPLRRIRWSLVADIAASGVLSSAGPQCSVPPPIQARRRCSVPASWASVNGSASPKSDSQAQVADRQSQTVR